MYVGKLECMEWLYITRNIPQCRREWCERTRKGNTVKKRESGHYPCRADFPIFFSLFWLNLMLSYSLSYCGVDFSPKTGICAQCISWSLCEQTTGRLSSTAQPVRTLFPDYYRGFIKPRGSTIASNCRNDDALNSYVRRTRSGRESFGYSRRATRAPSCTRSQSRCDQFLFSLLSPYYY